jgi:hypothetical protein
MPLVQKSLWFNAVWAENKGKYYQTYNYEPEKWVRITHRLFKKHIVHLR